MASKFDFYFERIMKERMEGKSLRVICEGLPVECTPSEIVRYIRRQQKRRSEAQKLAKQFSKEAPEVKVVEPLGIRPKSKFQIESRKGHESNRHAIIKVDLECSELQREVRELRRLIKELQSLPGIARWLEERRDMEYRRKIHDEALEARFKKARKEEIEMEEAALLLSKVSMELRMEISGWMKEDELEDDTHFEWMARRRETGCLEPKQEERYQEDKARRAALYLKLTGGGKTEV
jgi:hypothetical protein